MTSWLYDTVVWTGSWKAGEDWAEEGQPSGLDQIKAELRAAKDYAALDAVWKERVMKNRELDGKAKFELQELLLERKKAIKKSR